MTQKFLNYSLARARNNEHYEFYKLFLDYVTVDVANTLEIKGLYDSLIKLFGKEEAVISTLRIYEETVKIQELDHQRDDIYAYIVQDVKNKQRSPIEEESAAAKILEPIFQQHLQVPSETQLGESGALSYLLKTVKNNHSKELEVLGLSITLDKLSAINVEFEKLLLSRDDESQRRKTISNMQAVRKEIDAKHTEVVNMLNGLWLVLNINAEAEAEKLALLDELSEHLNSFAVELFNKLRERAKRNSK